MKYDLLSSDLAGCIAEFFGFLAAAITFQKALMHWMHGDPSVGVNMGIFGALLFLFASCFLVARAYERMLDIAVPGWGRIRFLLFSALWIASIAFVFYTTSDHDLVGLPGIVPWLFSLLAIAALAIAFCLVFLPPGFAFRPYRVAQTDTADHSPLRTNTLSETRHFRRRLPVRRGRNHALHKCRDGSG